MMLFAVTATLCLATSAHGTLCRDTQLLKHETMIACHDAEARDIADWMAAVRQVFGPDYVLRKHECAPFVPPPEEVE